MGKYLITLKPMEPYFFGGERTFGFGRKTGQKQKYYIVSENTPSQPTLFGTLRYIILSRNNALWNQTDAHKAESLVGKESFSFENINNAAGFGIINGISPLFLIKEDETDNNKVTWFVRTPMDHKPKTSDIVNEKYTPLRMAKSPVTFGNGSTLYPADYNPKDGCGGGYISLDEKLEVIPDDEIFESVTQIGINSHRTEDTSNGIEDDSSFFKKERKKLAKGFCFAFIADLSEELKGDETSVVFMGQNKSPFLCSITETNESLIKRTEDAFASIRANRTYKIKYALSDVMPVEDSFPASVKPEYYIADTKVLRSLETVSGADSYYNRLKKSEKLYKLITAGSVFYTSDLPEALKNTYLEKIGMNIFVDI